MFGSVKLTKNTDPDNYGYSDAHSLFSLPNGKRCKNVILGVDNSPSRHTDNRKKICFFVKIQQMTEMILP